MNPADLEALRAIRDNRPYVSVQGVTQEQAARLERDGLVVTDRVDARGVRLRLTARGQAALREADPPGAA